MTEALSRLRRRRRVSTASMRCWRELATPALLLATACARAPAPAPSARPAGDARPTLVAVFAHPDDETIVSAVLAHYARAGVRVVLVTATDGRLGTAPHAHIPAGDSLAAVRAEETRCAARALGIDPPILLGFPDAGLAVLSPWPGEPLDRMAARLTTVLRDLHPDAVITWGPEGGYGHQDHRLVGDVVTQLFQAGSLGSSARLYYVGFTADRTSTAPPWFGHRVYPTADALLTTSVAIDDQDLAAARAGLECHRSQATAAEMDTSFAAMRWLWQGRVRFRAWDGSGGRADGLF